MSLISTPGRQRQVSSVSLRSLRSAWSIERVSGQPEVHREALSPKQKQTNNKKKNHVTVISALGRKRKDSEVQSQSELHGNSKAIWVIWNHVFKF